MGTAVCVLSVGFFSCFFFLAHSCALAGANLVGSDLYNKLSEYFIIHFRPMLQVRCDECLLNLMLIAPSSPLQKAETLSDVDLLRYYASEWDRYTTGANYLNRLFTYLNRYWVKRERDEGKKGVFQVYTVRFVLMSFPQILC